MAAITSNGTGGGDWSVGATWTGGVAPGLGDTAQIQNGDVVTIDATFTVGDDTATPALDILNGGEVDWDNLGSDTCTFRGDFYVRNGGTLTLDGTATRTNILTIQLNDSAALAAGKYGLITEDGAIIDVDGFDYTRAWDTLSADAAAAQANVVTTNDNSAIWFVGDQFCVGSMSTVGNVGAEIDTIGAFAGATITKAGANYASIHEQNVAFCHMTRNVIVTQINNAFQGYISILNTTPGNVDFAWCRFDEVGTAAATKTGVSFPTTAHYGVFTGCVFYQIYYAISSGNLTLSSCCFVYSRNRDLSRSTGTDADSVFIKADTNGLYDVTFTTATGCHYANSDGLHGWFRGPTTISDCRFYGNVNLSPYVSVSPSLFNTCYMDGNLSGMYVAASITRLTDCVFGAQVANTQDFGSVSAIVIGTGINTIILSVTVSGSADNRVSIEGTANNHKTWKAAGEYEKQGVVVRTGTYAMLMSPSSATDALVAESTVPAENGTQVVASCYMRKNAAYGGANLPFLRLSGKGMVTDTDTMTDVDDTWQLLTVSGTPTSDGFARVEFVCQSAGVGAAAYVDDVKMVYTAIDTGSMDFWFEGDTPPVLMSTGLGAVDVWDVLLTQISTPLSIGVTLETNVDAVMSTLATAASIAALNDLSQAQILSDATPFPGANVDATISSRAMAASIAALNDISVADILTGVVEGVLTVEQMLRIFQAVLAGKSAGGGTNTITFRDVADAKDRVTATVDASGNRTAIVVDGA